MYVPPPPRRGWGPKALVVGAIGLVVLSAATSVAAYRLGRRTAPTPGEPSTSTVLGASGDDGMRGRAEEAPPPPSTPSASLAARPAWAGADWAPQVSRPVELFVEATPIAGDLDGAFVICRFQSFGQADTFAGDDLRVSAVFGKAPELTVRGPEDANLAFVSAPTVTLHHGDGLRFEVYDRDVFGDALLTRVHPAFDGKLADADKGAAYECRTLTADAHARMAKTYAAAADGHLSSLASRHLAGTDASWGYPFAEVERAESTTSDLAALAGWADARTARRVEKVNAQLARLEGERAGVFARLHEAATICAKLDDLDVQLTSVDCAGPACTTRLAITNRGSAALDLESVFAPTVYVATAESGPVRARFAGETLAPKASAEVTVESTGAALTPGPSLLGLCSLRRCATLATR